MMTGWFHNVPYAIKYPNENHDIPLLNPQQVPKSPANSIIYYGYLMVV